jgi:hypothetical protein
MFGIGQAWKRQVFFFPITLEGFGSIGAKAKDFRVTRGKGRILIPQTREMGAAVRSKKAPQKDQDNILFPFKLSQTHWSTVLISQFKIRGQRENFHLNFPVISRSSVNETTKMCQPLP